MAVIEDLKFTATRYNDANKACKAAKNVADEARADLDECLEPFLVDGNFECVFEDNNGQNVKLSHQTMRSEVLNYVNLAQVIGADVSKLVTPTAYAVNEIAMALYLHENPDKADAIAACFEAKTTTRLTLRELKR